MQPGMDNCRIIVENAFDPILVTDNAGIVTYANPAAGLAFGSAPQALAGRSLDELIQPACSEEFAIAGLEQESREPQAGPEAAKHGARHVALTCRRSNGSRFGMTGSISPLRRKDETVGSLVMLHSADALHKSRETLRLATEIGDIGLWDYYPGSGELRWSETNRRLFGVPPEQPLTLPFFMDLIHPADRGQFDIATRHALKQSEDGRFDVEFRAFRQSDGALRWYRGKGKVILAANGGLERILGTNMDVTDAKLAEQRVREASQHDPLTGLPNRALLLEYCSRLLAIARRTGSSGALLFIDLDRFKPINDMHGHDVGDQVLKQVANRLLESTRKEDVAGRFGGDEFVVAIPHTGDTHGPATAARHIIERISAPYYVGDLVLRLSASIGISMFPRDGTDIDTLVKCADIAMYAAKRSGPGRYRIYGKELERGEDQSQEAMEAMEARLRHALEHGGFALHYQPVTDMETGRPVGVEALLRLPLPEGGALTPEQLLPVAEAAGLIDRIGDWVAQEACRQHRAWRDAGLPDIGMSINVAPQQVRQRSFAGRLAENARRNGMNPSCLQIELRENAVTENAADTIATLEEIRSHGIRVALDDFGIGHASLGQLSLLPLDKLKIDQSFISRIASDARSRAVAGSILALGHSMNLKVVGEGIESEDAFDYLREHGCDQAQGYYVSRPLTADEFVRWYAAHDDARHAAH